MFRSTYLGFYAMFPMFCSSFCSMLMLGLCAHMLDTMSMVMLCLDLCVCMLFAIFMLRSASVHAYMFGFTFFHVYVLSFCMLTHVLHMPMPRSMFMCLDLRFHMFVCLDLGFSHACVLRSMLYLLYAIFHVFVHSMPYLHA